MENNRIRLVKKRLRLFSPQYSTDEIGFDILIQPIFLFSYGDPRCKLPLLLRLEISALLLDLKKPWIFQL